MSALAEPTVSAPARYAGAVPGKKTVFHDSSKCALNAILGDTACSKGVYRLQTRRCVPIIVCSLDGLHRRSGSPWFLHNGSELRLTILHLSLEALINVASIVAIKTRLLGGLLGIPIRIVHRLVCHAPHLFCRARAARSSNVRLKKGV